MKRAAQGTEAFNTIIGAELPERTKTYTPIKHSDIINKIRNEIASAGYKITEEKFRSSNGGKIALGTFILNYKSDPDIALCASFVNSYNKQYAFRFNLGGIAKESGNTMIINDKFGAYKRVHKGNADILADGKISEFIQDAEEYWNVLLLHKQHLKDETLTNDQRNMIVGNLFLDKEVLNTLQLNIVQKELKKPSFDYKTPDNSAWSLYNHITLSLKESRPATWLEDQIGVHDVFHSVINFDNAGLLYGPAVPIVNNTDEAAVEAPKEDHEIDILASHSKSPEEILAIKNAIAEQNRDRTRRVPESVDKLDDSKELSIPGLPEPVIVGAESEEEEKAVMENLKAEGLASTSVPEPTSTFDVEPSAKPMLD